MILWSVDTLEVDAAIDQVELAFEDLTPVWRQLQAWYTATAEERFAGGAHWRPLTPKYAAWKEEHAPGRGLLELTGELHDAMTEPQVHDIGPTQAVIGILTGRSDLFRAQILNRRRRLMPHLPAQEVDALEESILAMALGAR